MDKLIDLLKDILEVDIINYDDILTEYETWDSLTALSLIAAIGEEYGIYLNTKDIIEAHTIGNLIKKIQY